MPQWLIGDARTEWKRIIPILEKMGILAEVDRTMLALYCKAYAEWREADGLVGSLLKKNPSGRICPHPALVIRDSAFHRLYKTCSEFGMSPSSRTGLAITPKSHKQDDDKSRFFYRKQTHEPDSA
jgi:P27 family predicted phage terminase small subunit